VSLPPLVSFYPFLLFPPQPLLFQIRIVVLRVSLFPPVRALDTSLLAPSRKQSRPDVEKIPFYPRPFGRFLQELMFSFFFSPLSTLLKVGFSHLGFAGKSPCDVCFLVPHDQPRIPELPIWHHPSRIGFFHLYILLTLCFFFSRLLKFSG